MPGDWLAARWMWQRRQILMLMADGDWWTEAELRRALGARPWHDVRAILDDLEDRQDAESNMAYGTVRPHRTPRVWRKPRRIWRRTFTSPATNEADYLWKPYA